MGKSYFKFVERFYGYGLSPSSYIACTSNEYSFNNNKKLYQVYNFPSFKFILKNNNTKKEQQKFINAKFGAFCKHKSVRSSVSQSLLSVELLLMNKLFKKISRWLNLHIHINVQFMITI